MASILAAGCIWPLFLVFQWVGVNVATLERLTRTDPAGLRLYPAFVMFVRPALAAVAALSAFRAAVLVITQPRQAFAVLLRSAVAQASLLLAIFLTGPAIDRTLGRMVPLFEDRHTPGAVIAADFARMQAEASAGILPPLAAVAVACGVLAALTRGSR